MRIRLEEVKILMLSWLYARVHIEGNFLVVREDDEFQTKMKESEKRLEKLDEASLTRQPEEVSRVQDRINIRLDLTPTRFQIDLNPVVQSSPDNGFFLELQCTILPH